MLLPAHRVVAYGHFKGTAAWLCCAVLPAPGQSYRLPGPPYSRPVCTSESLKPIATQYRRAVCPRSAERHAARAGAGRRSGTDTSLSWHQARNGHFACDQYGLPDVPTATAPGPATTRRRGSAGERGRGWRREGVVQERTEEISVTPHADPTGREQTPPKQSSRAGPVATKTPAGSPSRRSASAAA